MHQHAVLSSLSCHGLVQEVPVVFHTLLTVSDHAQAWRAVSSTNVHVAKRIFLNLKLQALANVVLFVCLYRQRQMSSKAC